MFFELHPCRKFCTHQIYHFHPYTCSSWHSKISSILSSSTSFHVSSKECSNSSTPSNIFSCFVQRMFT
jgi:hypothetical protein